VRVGDGTGAGRAELEGTGTGVRARVGDGTGLGIEVRDGTGAGAKLRDGTGEGVAEPGPGLLRDTAESSPALAGWPPPPDDARARLVPPASRAATGTPSQAIARLLGVLI
jgi:hypothetical protein